MRRAALISNPIAGRRKAGRRVERLIQIFERHDWCVELRETNAPGAGESRAREAVEQGFDAVLALGGDGTLRECAAGLLGSETALGFLPCGTTNVMGHALGTPANPFRAAELLAGGGTARMDAGVCGTTPFLMQASCGIDAAVIAALDPQFKRFLGKGAVVPAGANVLARYGFPRFEIVIDGRVREVSFAAICNIPFYGGKWRMTQAEIDDGRLHAALFTGRGRPSTLAFAAALFLGRHQSRKDFEVFPVEEVELPAVPELALQMDGDPFPGLLPAKVRVVPGGVKILTPASS